MISALQHDLFCAEDYQRIREVGILTARDGLRWHRIDREGSYDWSSWLPMLEAAGNENIQIMWDLFHYGWPDDLDVFSPEFIDRFARFSGEAARIHREHTDAVAIYSPMNEVSFFAWGASRDLIFPYAHGRDSELKRQLVRAAIASTEAIRAVDPRARIISPEPLIHNVPPIDEPWNTRSAMEQRNSQFEAWDMISGRAAPELNGRESLLDIIGVNFYAPNQWEVPGGRKLHWDAGSEDPRWMPLHQLLMEVHTRYQRPLFIAETSHYGIGRAPWLNEICVEVCKAMHNGVPIEGVCLYPILDRFDWENFSHWHNCGLWDIQMDGAGHYQRVLNPSYARALAAAQQLLPKSFST